jgi:hypothetical protein
VDGVGAIVKRALKVDQLQNPIKEATRCNWCCAIFERGQNVLLDT